MIEVEFRGKEKIGREWIYGTGYTDFLNVYGKRKEGLWLWSNYAWLEIKPDSVGIWTGELDGEGGKIYNEV